MRLNKMSISQSGEVAAVEENDLKPKLTDMGLIPGKQIRVLFKAPLGDPIAIDVEGYILSLRLEEASLILIKPHAS
ncbi:MAG: ferrous iron transport protein A [Bacteroidetes bacterium]|nr:ferrous iron transport protein A [Bacteroidota bacterium]